MCVYCLDWLAYCKCGPPKPAIFHSPYLPNQWYFGLVTCKLPTTTCMLLYMSRIMSQWYPPSCPRVHLSEVSVTSKTTINASNTSNAKMPSLMSQLGSGVRTQPSQSDRVRSRFSYSFHNKFSEKWILRHWLWIVPVTGKAASTLDFWYWSPSNVTHNNSLGAKDAQNCYTSFEHTRKNATWSYKLTSNNMRCIMLYKFVLTDSLIDWLN